MDDFLIVAPESRIRELSALVQLVLATLGCPMSWHKTSLGSSVDYLGFTLNLRDATVGIPERKFRCAEEFLDSFRQGQYVTLKAIEKGRGRLLWMTWISPVLRPWLAPFFQCENQTCRGSRVRVSGQLTMVAKFWHSVLANYENLHKCTLPIDVGTFGAADACAKGQTACLGGWFCDGPNDGLSDIHWFKLRLDMSDLPDWLRPQVSAQQRIAFWELLAQVILVALRLRTASGIKGCLRVRQVCDNSTAVSVSKKFFCTKAPLSYGLQALAWHASQACADIQISFCPGKKNVWADKISRWEQFPEFMAQLNPAGEIKDFSIREILDPVWDFANAA